MSSSSGLVPEAEASARLGAGISFFDFDHFNYIVALKRAYSDISFKDLTTGFNHHYNRKTSEAELKMIFEETKSAAQGEKSYTATPEMIAPFHFWPEKGFNETEMHKLFILASFRHAYETSMKMVKADGGITTGLPRPTSSNLRASKSGFISYESLSGSSSKSLIEIYNDRMKETESS